MIDEKQLIEDFKNTFSDSVLNQTFGFGKYTFLEAIEEMINRQPQIVTDTNVGSKWIPCSERLPKEAGDYFVTLYNGNAIDDYCDGYRIAKRFFDDKGWWDDIDDAFGWNLIAWMPLPEPYKE